MTSEAKNTFEQLFNIAQARSREIISMPDDEILIEANKDSTLKSDGIMAKNAYLKALKTVNYQESKEFEQKNNSFNLANILIKGMEVSLVRQKIMGLAAENDPSLQLVAGRVSSLSDDEALKIYQNLLSTGVLKSDPK